ncbi:Eukaryotic translation initiation factor 3 subunit B [Rhizoctonia solani]|uniref:Eukaryotic translation initiation factor 3 subunit B n=1 Tax=Rhizoctonia solani TaxID=456999 RepID=A0A8H7M5D2_9AGAM|nr:Eukaryotic translation initiation factor 3 subunit B [Rhizoctonia solani]
MPVPDPVPAEDLGIDYSDIEAKYSISYEEGFDNVLVVDGVPIIDRSRESRLFAKISKEFGRKGVPIKEGGIHMPYEEGSGKSKGYIFVEFASPEEASDALVAMHHFPFDAKHTFSINRFTDIEKYATLDETYVPPAVSNYTSRPHMRSWLADPAGRDQFLTYVGDEVQIFWNARTGPDPAFTRHNWTDLYVAWSPHGTYLTTLHRQGLQIWGGSEWGLVRRIAHPLARLVDFSPNEKYLVTWSNEPIVIPPGAQQGPTFFSPDDEGNNLAVWEWSGDDRYVARVNPGQAISVYEVPSMHMLDKKSIKIDGVVDFEWCPPSDDELSKIRETEKEGDRDATGDGKKGKRNGVARVRENMLAYWVPEVANQPARVTLLAIPSRTQLRTKNLFSVSECKLYWQNQGDFLCVKVDRPTKSKKATFCNLEVFRTREKDFPVEVIELKGEFKVPRGDRFAILSSSDPNLGNIAPGITIKMDVSFFQLEKGKNFKLLKLLKDKTTNAIRWSPKGRHVVLGSIFPVTRFELEFYDLEFTIDPERINTHTAEWGSLVQHLATAEHYGVTDVEWDPSGRYVASSASELVKQPADKFKQFLWRPRPKTLLTKAQQKEVRKNLKEYSRAFDEADAAEESHADKELVAQRRRLLDEWNAWRKKVRPEVQERMARLGRKAKGGEDREEVEEWLEEVIEEIIEVLQG